MTRSGEHAAAQTAAPSSGVGSMESFYDDQWTAVVAVTASLCRDVAAAEEIAQEAFLRAHQRWDVVSVMDRPDLWVRRVALNLAVSRFRRLQAEARALARIAFRRPTAEPPTSGATEELWDALRALPPRQAQAAALHYVDDLAVVEVAQVLGCAEGTVKAHLHAARRRLRSILETSEVIRDDT